MGACRAPCRRCAHPAAPRRNACACAGRHPLTRPAWPSARRLVDSCLVGVDATGAGHAFLRDLLVQTARHAFRHSFSSAQITAFTALTARVLAEDVASWQRPARASFDHLQRLVLEVSVDRPPAGIPLLTPLQATLGVDFLLKTYYAHYALYKTTCARVPEPTSLAQEDCAGVEPVHVPRPLADAVLLQSGPGGGGQ